MVGEANNSTDDDKAASPPAGNLTPAEEAEFEALLEEEAAEDDLGGPEPTPAPPAPPAPPPPAVHAPAPEELFGKDAIRRLLEDAGARYPLGRERLLAWLRGRQVRFWRDFPPVPLDELIGLSQSSVFHSVEDVLAVADTHLRNKPQGMIFSTQHGRKG